VLNRTLHPNPKARPSTRNLNAKPLSNPYLKPYRSAVSEFSTDIHQLKTQN
jgi:hypothetical protein